MKFMFVSESMVPEKVEIIPYLCAHKIRICDSYYGRSKCY